MTMGLLAVAGITVALGFWLLASHARRRHGSAPMILAAMPLALLMLVTPIPLVALWTINAFTTIGQTGTATQVDAARLASTMINPLWWGSVGFVAVLCASAVFQRFETQRVESLMVESSVESQAGRWWANVAPSVSVLLIIPAVFLLFRQAEIATFLIDVASSLHRPGTRSIAGMSLEEFSRMISTRLLVGAFAGFALLALVMVLAVVNTFTFRASAHSEGLLMTSRGVFILGMGLGLWAVYVLTMNAGVFARAMG
jgi:hypothetical protein